MVPAAFKSLEDERKVAVLQRFASGKITSTAQAKAAVVADPFLKQALDELDKVHSLLFSNPLSDFLCAARRKLFLLN